MVEFGTEVNGDWFPWSGSDISGSETDGYGHSNYPDGPERSSCYRHIFNLFKNYGVDNITWVFHLSAFSEPDGEWNDFKYYYPGDDFVDWIGVSIYGPESAGQPWTSFNATLEDVYPKLSELSKTKPLAILEFAANSFDSDGEDKSYWIKNALSAVIDGKHPRIKAISYWHENWHAGHFRIDSSPAVLRAYKEGIYLNFSLTLLE